MRKVSFCPALICKWRSIRSSSQRSMANKWSSWHRPAIYQHRYHWHSHNMFKHSQRIVFNRRQFCLRILAPFSLADKTSQLHKYVISNLHHLQQCAGYLFISHSFNRINWLHRMAKFILQRYKMWPHQTLHYHYQKHQRSRSKGSKWINRRKKLNRNHCQSHKFSSCQRYPTQQLWQQIRMLRKQSQHFVEHRPGPQWQQQNRTIKRPRWKLNHPIWIQRLQ